MQDVGGVVPGDVVPVLTVLVLAFWLSMAVSIGLWVVRDARERGSDQPIIWGVASVVTPIGLPYYLYRRFRRSGIGPRRTPPTAFDRALATWAAASLGATVWGTVVAPPDPFTQLIRTFVAACVTVPLSYVLVYRGEYRTLRDRLGG